MKNFRRLWPAVAAVFALVLLTGLATAQAAASAQHWVPENYVPQAIAVLGQNASSRTEFTLDHNMLTLASKTDQSDDSVRRIIAGLDGISVHRFHYQGSGTYDPALLNDVRQQYRGAGWQHITVAHDKYGPGATDLWLHFENNTIRNVAVLAAGRDQVNFVTVSGAISPLDLFHLAGHFGIPKIEGGVVVPAPGAATSRADNPTHDNPAPDNAAPADNGPVDYRHENSAPNSPGPPSN